jgi:hypothetical protein
MSSKTTDATTPATSKQLASSREKETIRGAVVAGVPDSLDNGQAMSAIGTKVRVGLPNARLNGLTSRPIGDIAVGEMLRADSLVADEDSAENSLRGLVRRN